MQYTCEACGGRGGSGIRFPSCESCHGTGQKQITISLEEYDRLIAGNLPIQLLNRIKETVSDINKYDREELSPCWDAEEDHVFSPWLNDVIEHAGNIAVGVIEDAVGLQEYTAISKQEYDRLKLAEKQRVEISEALKGIMDLQYFVGVNPNSFVGAAVRKAEQVILSYGKKRDVKTEGKPIDLIVAEIVCGRCRRKCDQKCDFFYEQKHRLSYGKEEGE